MADNTTLNTGSGGDTIATDDIGGVKYQRVKVTHGADGSATDVSSASPLPVGDASGSLTVDAPVATPVFVRLSDGSAAITALPVTDNSGTLSVDDGAGSLTVDNATLSVTGGGVEASALRVTLASDSTGVVSVDDNGASLTVDGTVTVQDGGSAISVDDNGSTLSVDDGAGSLTVDNGGTFAVQVDGAALTALQLLDDTVLAEDAAHSTGDKGVMALAVRRDANTTLADTTGDYAPLQVDASGSLKVAIISGAGSGGTSATDDAAFSVASGSGTPIMGLADETTPDSVDEGDVGVVRMTLTRALHVNLRDASGSEVSVGGGTQYDEDAAHSTGSKVTGAGIVRKDTAAALAGTDGDYTLPISDANGKLWVNASGVTLTVDGSGVTQPVSHAGLTALNGAIAGTEVQVDIVGSIPAGANAIGKLAANTGVDIGDVDVTSVIPGSGATNLGKAEDAAHASGDVGVMALAVRKDAAAASSGTDGDYEPLSTDSTGQLRVAVGNTVTVGAHAVTNAGTFAVQESGAALTALQLLDDVVFAEDAASTTGDKGVQVLTKRTDTAAASSGTDGDYQPLITDSSGRLHVNVGNTVTVGSHAVTNAGTFAVQVDGSALTALQKIDDPVLVDDAAFTPATSSVMMAGFEADEASTDSVDEGDAGAARMTLDRKVIVNPQPHTAGGLSIFRSLDLDETEEEVKSTAGQVYTVWFTNTATSTRWLKFYTATAANVTVGTTTPVLTLGLPGNSSDDISGVFSGTMGFTFDTAITVAATTGVADNDTGAPGANEVIVNLGYK
jgi:hypothetical protein